MRVPLRCWFLATLSLVGCVPGPKEAPGFETPAWGTPGSLRLRSGEDGALLLRQLEGGRQVESAVYRFEPVSRAFSASSPEAWSRGTGEANCDQQAAIVPGEVTAPDGGLPFPLGEVLVRGAKARGGGQVAVISASSRGSSIMSFVGQGYRPPYFHRLFALPGNAPSGPALKLPFGSHTSDVSLCWSSDDRFVVYTDLFMTSVAIIDLSSPSVP